MMVFPLLGRLGLRLLIRSRRAGLGFKNLTIRAVGPMGEGTAHTSLA